jgi:hypothetical protein
LTLKSQLKWKNVKILYLFCPQCFKKLILPDQIPQKLMKVTAGTVDCPWNSFGPIVLQVTASLASLRGLMELQILTAPPPPPTEM